MDTSGLQNTSFDMPPSQFTGDSPKKSKRFLFVVIFLVLVGGIAYATGAVSKVKKFLPATKEVSVAPTTVPTPVSLPTDILTPTEEAVSPTSIPKVTNTPTAKPTGNPIDKATGFDRSTLSVEVKNGNGVVGAASKMSDFLKSLGYHVTAVGNADNENYETTTISVKSDASKYLPLLKTDLTGSYTIGSSSATLDASSSADALVIVGKE